MEQPVVRCVAGLVAGLLWLPIASAQEQTPSIFSFGGLAFGDFYHVPSFHEAEDEGSTWSTCAT